MTKTEVKRMYPAKVQYLLESDAMSRHLSKISPRTHNNVLYYTHDFLTHLKGTRRFTNYGLDELIDYQRESDKAQEYDIIDEIIQWLNSKQLRHGTLRNYYVTIRGIFQNNRAPLPKEKMNFRADKPKVASNLTPEIFKQVVAKSNKMYRAIFLCKLASGMGTSEFIEWSNTGYNNLMEQIQNDYVKIDLYGRKGSLYKETYYTIISGDALEALRHYIKERKSGTSIFVTQFGKPVTIRSITNYWLRMLKELGHYETGESKHRSRSGMGIHETRDLFRTLFRKSNSDQMIPEFMMQHTVDKNGYDKAMLDVNWVWSEYQKALPYLNIVTNNIALGLVNEHAVIDNTARVSNLEEALNIQIQITQKLLQAMQDQGIKIDSTILNIE